MFANRTVVTYHYYDPPQFSAEEQIRSHAKEARRLGTAQMMTETEAIWAAGKYKHLKANLTDACDAQLTGWADWAWKSFVRRGPGDGDASNPSQFYEWGSPKTGHGVDWVGPDEPPPYYRQYLARTYAPRVVGSHVKMAFSTSTSDFELQYDVGGVEPDVPSEVFLWPPRYPGGAEVAVSASVGAVRVDYNGTGSWVRVFPGAGLEVGARVTLTITAKKDVADVQ